MFHYNAVAVDGQEHTVRVISDIYGTMVASRVYMAPEEETVEDPVSDSSMVAILALVLALIALLVAFVTPRIMPGKTHDVAGKEGERQHTIEVDDEWEVTTTEDE